MKLKTEREGTEHWPESLQCVQDCLGRVSLLEQLKCRARSLQREADSLEEEIDRLEVAAAAEGAQEYMQSYVIASTPSTGTVCSCHIVLHHREVPTHIVRRSAP